MAMTTSVGAIVQAISIWMLPCTCSGSEPSSPGFSRNRNSTYKKMHATIARMIELTPNSRFHIPTLMSPISDTGSSTLRGVFSQHPVNATLAIAASPNVNPGAEVTRSTRRVTALAIP